MTIEGQGQEPEPSKEDIERLAAHLDEDDAATREIRDMSKISRATWEGRAATDIIAEYGGLEALERKVGSEAARELEERAVREETGFVEDDKEGDK